MLMIGSFNMSSRGDTQEYSDLNKMAKRFLKGNHNALEGEAGDVPSRAYVQEVLEELRKGDQGECPICLEAFEDAVLTPCAHRLCRECLLASWRNLTSGLCPVCRYLLELLILHAQPHSLLLSQSKIWFIPDSFVIKFTSSEFSEWNIEI